MATRQTGVPRSIVDALWPSAASASRPNTGVSISLTPPPKMLTVSLDDSAIRLVAFEGHKIVDWASIDMYSDDLAIPKRFHRYAGRLNRKIVDLPFYAPLVRFIERPEVKRRFLDSVVKAQAIATIPFDQSEVDIAWSPVSDDKKSDIMVTAVPKREADAVVDLVNLSQVSPSAMYSKASALAFAVGIPNAVVAHLSHETVDLVLVRDDLAKTVHRINIPGETDPENSASVLAQAIDELTAFEAEHIDSPDAKEIDSVVLTGGMTTPGPLVDAIRIALGKRIRSVSPRVWYPDGFPTPQYAINVGLALADWSVRSSSWRSAEGGRVRPTDLLPERHRVRVLPKRTAKLVAISAATLAIVLSSMVGTAQAHTGVNALQASVSTLESQARLNAAQAARLNGQQTQIDSIQAEINSISNIDDERSATMQTDLARLNLMTVGTAIKRVTPTDVSMGKGHVSIAAVATSINQALAYADMLRASDLFTTVTITDVSANSSNGKAGASVYSVNVTATYPYTDPGKTTPNKP